MEYFLEVSKQKRNGNHWDSAKTLGNLIILDGFWDLHKESDEGRSEGLESDIMKEFRKK